MDSFIPASVIEKLYVYKGYAKDTITGETGADNLDLILPYDHYLVEGTQWAKPFNKDELVLTLNPSIVLRYSGALRTGAFEEIKLEELV